MTSTPQNAARYGRTVYGYRYASTPGAQWGSLYQAGAKGSTANAKSDTQFLSTPGSIEVDASQQATDMALTSGAVVEASSARTAFDGTSGFEYVWTGTIDAAATDYRLIYRGTGVGLAYLQVALDPPSANQRRLFVQVNATATAVVVADFPAGTATVQVQISARPNPLTTGAADALVIEAAVVVDGTWYMGQDVFPAVNTSADFFVGGGAYSGGAVVNQPPSTTAVRVSSRFHTMTEFGEDFVLSRGSAGTNYETKRQPLAIKKTDGIGTEGQWFGQSQFSAAADAARSVQRRLYGPLWGEVFRIGTDREPGESSPWAKANAFGDGYTAYADLVRWVPVPPGATHLQVHIEANNWAEVGGFYDINSARSMSVKAYSLASLPVAALSDPTQLGGGQIVSEFNSAKLDIDASDNRPPGPGFPGDWYNVGILPIARSASVKPAYANTTFLALSIIDNSGTGEGRLRINAVRFVPLNVPEQDEGSP
jgi:hypothetical protein